MAAIRDAQISFPCPKCGDEIRKSLGWLDDHDTVVCDTCDTRIGLHKKDFQAVSQIDRKLTELGKPFKGIKL